MSLASSAKFAVLVKSVCSGKPAGSMIAAWGLATELVIRWWEKLYSV